MEVRPQAAPSLDPLLSQLFASGVADERKVAAGRLFVPQVRSDRLSAAAFDGEGMVLAASAEFPRTDAADVIASRRNEAAALVTCARADGGQCLVALAPTAIAGAWRMPDSARKIADTHGAETIGLSAAYVRSNDAVAEACASLGLTALQSRLIAALSRHGDLERAARESDVVYSTAREAVAGAMVRVGVKKRSALIQRVVSLAFGVLPDVASERYLLRDAWGLTARQAALAVAIAQGASRAEAARSIGVSEAVAKKELANTFLALGVASTTELSALLAEAAALAALIEATDSALAIGPDGSEPLRLIPRESGEGMIAFSDYGPKNGAPVLVLHSSSASRPVPSRLVAALQARGFRPFAIDRPGFGLTDWLERMGDPFATACEDIRTVCAHLRFEKIDLIARGGAQTAMHLAAQSPDLLARVVLVAPDPPSRISRPTSGILGAVKQAFQSNPHLIEPLTRLFVANLATSNVRDLMFKTIRNSPPDLEVMEDMRNLADYCRGFQMFLSGRIRGYVREQSALVTEADPPANPSADHWRVLIGAHDPLHDPREAEHYWRTLLPKARFETLHDGGRFLVMSHADHVAECLRQAPSAPS